MCGRYLAITEDDFGYMKNIVDYVSDKYKDSNVAKGEIFPTNNIPVIYSYNGKKILSAARWGFPGFKKSAVIINARAETVAEKPMFRDLFATKRCIVPARGYYEWLTHEDKSKTKYLITVEEKTLVYMAGLYNMFTNENNIVYAATVIITTDANSDIAFIHNRMPVVLTDDSVNKWLDKKTANINSLQNLIVSYKTEGIKFEAKEETVRDSL
jgi:putative SOS response-associated peptidase YedK